MPSLRSQPSCRLFKTASTPKSPNSLIPEEPSPESSEQFVAILASRILAAFGILHVVTEYCVDLTRCEGPSMMPTIQPFGEIIVIEKITHRIHGLEGGNKGEDRAKNARVKQKEWEQMEHQKWLKSKRRERSETYSPTWYETKLPQANHGNYERLSSLSQIISRFTTGVHTGDVVVLEHPDREGTVCKRVLGLPGDIILRPKDNFRYSSKHREVMNIFDDDDEEGEGKGEGEISNVTSLSESSLEVVPDGHLWVEGDNSLNSADSRNYGSVPSALVVGKVWLRIWPITGDSILVRGGRPMPKRSEPFTGSTLIPAGCEGEARVESRDV